MRRTRYICVPHIHTPRRRTNVSKMKRQKKEQRTASCTTILLQSWVLWRFDYIKVTKFLFFVLFCPVSVRDDPFLAFHFYIFCSFSSGAARVSEWKQQHSIIPIQLSFITSWIGIVDGAILLTAKTTNNCHDFSLKRKINSREWRKWSAKSAVLTPPHIEPIRNVASIMLPLPMPCVQCPLMW